jgi:outer membrane protein insertion porin family
MLYSGSHWQRYLALCFLLVMTATAVDLNSQDNEPRVKKIELSGNDYFSTRHLRSLMETRTKPLLQKPLFWKKAPRFSPEILEDDLKRIIRAYQRDGYLHAAIEGKEIRYDEEEKQVTIRIRIKENSRVTIHRVDLEFTEHPAAADFSLYREKLTEEIQLYAGAFYSDDLLRDDLKTIRSFFEKLGYPYINASHDLYLAESELEVDVKYLIDPGPEVFYGEIRFNGLSKIDQSLLHRFLTLQPGDRYDRQKMDQTRSRLQALNLFQFVSVNLRSDSQGEKVPVEINLREKESVSLNFGTGYGLEDRFRVYGEITKLRFLGGLRIATIFAKHSYLEPINLDLKVTQPGFPTIRSNTVFNPFYRREREPGYEIERVGANTTVNYRLSATTATYLAYTFENNRLEKSADFPEPGDTFLYSVYHEDLPADELNNRDDSITGRITPDVPRSYIKSSITWGIIRNSSRPDFYPDRGSILSNTVTLSGIGFGSDYQYLRVLPEARFYFSLSDYLILASRIKGGTLKELKDNEYIPAEDRFYAGGTYSVRGWARSRLGPLSAEDQPLGGKSLLEGSFEFRYPLWKQLSGVAFFDYGNVWSGTFDHNVNDLRYASGGGLRFATPVGPFRFDVGIPVGEGKKQVQFFISLGQAF